MSDLSFVAQASLQEAGSALLVASHAATFAEEARCLSDNGYRVGDEITMSQLLQQGRATADVVLVDDHTFRADLANAASLRRCVDGALVVVGRRFDEIDEIIALELGADEYLARPFTPRKLLARLRKLERRRQMATTESARANALWAAQTRFGPLQLDRTSMRVTCNGDRLHLSPPSFEALFLLAMRAPGIVTRGEMCARLYRRSMPSVSRSVDMSVFRMREQLRSQGAAVKVATVRAAGYRLELTGGDAQNW